MSSWAWKAPQILGGDCWELPCSPAGILDTIMERGQQAVGADTEMLQPRCPQLLFILFFFILEDAGGTRGLRLNLSHLPTS